MNWEFFKQLDFHDFAKMAEQQTAIWTTNVDNVNIFSFKFIFKILKICDCHDDKVKYSIVDILY